MNTLKLSKLKILLKTNSIYVRFKTKRFYKSGLLQDIKRKRDGTLSCVFNENGNLEYISFHEDALIDVVVFCTADSKPVFLKDFEAENRMRHFWE